MKQQYTATAFCFMRTFFSHSNINDLSIVYIISGVNKTAPSSGSNYKQGQHECYFIIFAPFNYWNYIW